MSVKPETSSDETSSNDARPYSNDVNDAEDTGRSGAQSAAQADDSAVGGSAGTADPDVAALEARADENWNKYLRAAAELENVRKRAARDMENARKFALERFATELLAVKDSLEMGLSAAEGSSATELIEGNKATLKQFAATLERFGVEELDPQGEPFDPALHEAMTMQPSTEVEPNTVVTVFQKGYILNGRLLRPARVVVAAAPGAA